MNINIDKQKFKKFGIPLLLIVLLFSCLAIKEKSMTKEFNLTLSSINAEKENLNNKITSLENEITKAREENGYMADQLRDAKEDLRDAGRRVKDNDDELIIEAYELFLSGKNAEAQKKIQVLYTTYLTDLQLHIYKKIMIDK